MDSLIRYASRRLLLHLAEHPYLPTEPNSLSFYSSIMFADMKDFTILAEQLTRNDPVEGVNTLAGYLDIYIGKLVEIITRHGGDIVKFAGDAVIAIWPAESKDNLPRETLRAAECGLDIQKELHNFEVDKDVILSIRVGVGAGLLHELHLGGHLFRWEMLIAGDPVTQVGAAGKLAEPGQVVLSKQAWKTITRIEAGRRSADQKHFRLTRPRQVEPLGPRTVPIVTPAAMDAMRSYIPRAILVGQEEGRPLAAELRRITVLFCKVETFGYTERTPVADVQIIMLIMQECLYRYEGSINRFGVDEKGAILLAAFGLPPLHHEDDPYRGLMAASDIRKELQSIGHDARIGIATGNAFCGPVGSATRSEYTMHGVNVNLAARLMVRADSILCDEATREATGDSFSFAEQPSFKIKGRETPVRIFEPELTG